MVEGVYPNSVLCCDPLAVSAFPVCLGYFWDINPGPCLCGFDHITLCNHVAPRLLTLKLYDVDCNWIFLWFRSYFWNLKYFKVMVWTQLTTVGPQKYQIRGILLCWKNWYSVWSEFCVSNFQKYIFVEIYARDKVPIKTNKTGELKRNMT